jgi:hypothetical protein
MNCVLSRYLLVQGLSSEIGVDAMNGSGFKPSGRLVWFAAIAQAIGMLVLHLSLRFALI